MDHLKCTYCKQQFNNTSMLNKHYFLSNHSDPEFIKLLEAEKKTAIDEYGDFRNTDDAYKAIAKALLKDRAVLIGWTDEEATHFDILFAYKPVADIRQVLNGTLIADHFMSSSFQGGIEPSDLFVSIMRIGAFGFAVDRSDTNWQYYNEKLSGRTSIGEATSKKLAQLINGISMYL